MAHKFFAIDMTNLDADNILFYIPLDEFLYTGFGSGKIADGASGVTEGMGVDRYYCDFTTFSEGIARLSNNEGQVAEGTDPLALNSIRMSYRSANKFTSQLGSATSAAAVDMSTVSFVYDVTDETAVTKTESGYEASLYANEPFGVTDQTVTATVNGKTTPLTGVAQADDRVKYTLTGLTEADKGKNVSFAWSSAAAGVTKNVSTYPISCWADAHSQRKNARLLFTDGAGYVII